MSSADDLTTVVKGLLHEDTQMTERGLDLTVSEVYVVDEPGRIDFGGGELASATVTAHEKEWRDSDDDYQWWNLAAGQYLIEYNERLDAETPLLLQPRDETLERGASHPALYIEELPRIPLSVSEGGIKLKENARISTLIEK